MTTPNLQVYSLHHWIIKHFKWLNKNLRNTADREEYQGMEEEVQNNGEL